MNFAKLVKLAKWFANLAMGFAKLAMRNFAKVIWQWVCEIGNGLRIWQWGLRNAQYPAATVPLLLHPAASHPVSTASHFLHFALVFPLIYGLFDG